MALTAFQRRVCRLIAANRTASGESYVAGGTALNALLAGRRVSRDIDVFHDSADAVAASWESDRRLRSSGARSRATGSAPSIARNTCSRSAIWHGPPAARILASGELFIGPAEAATEAHAAGRLRFHEGRLRGALPQLAR